MRAKENFLPVFYQLAEDLKTQIELGELKPGDQIPSEPQLGEVYGISRMTVRRGLALLTEAGIIQTVRGKGNFVAEPRLNRLTLHFKENQSADEKQLRPKLLEVKSVSGVSFAAEMLNLPEGAKVIMIKSLIIGEKGPVALDVKHLPYIKGKPLLENEIEYADFPDIVARHTDVVIHKIEMNISSTVLQPEEALLLKAAPGFPALKVTRVIYSRDEKPLGISSVTYRADMFQLKAVSYPYS